ncbi:flippase [Methylotuvimicrobium buryatense]|uniref:Flippase n=1 Tax=Methylotuvimicrobium buryatense TaxID=95641 RepID=A0A4P9UKL5_METBY|nr:flippase [Methylotuvimicrobium buryatense]QCW80873.1 flippase [Methylotuvimicrobium buryatense]
MLNNIPNRIRSIIKKRGFIRYLNNILWLMSEKVLRIVAGLLVGIWVARFLGPEQFGVLSYVLSFTAIFGCVAKLGFDGILIRDLVNEPNERDKYLGTAFWLKIIGAILALTFIAVILPFTSNDATTNLYIFIIGAGIIFQGFEVIDFYFQSKVQGKVVSICKTIQLALSSLIKIYLVLVKAELLWFVLVVLVDSLSLAISYIVAYRLQKKPTFYRIFDLAIARKLLKESWPMIISGVAISVYMKIDQVMIKEIMGPVSVGYYAVAVRLTEVWLFITAAVTTSLFPAVLNAKKVDEKLYYQRLLNLYRLLILISVVISIAITLFSEEIVETAFGSEYLPSVGILIIYIWSNIFIFMNNGSRMWYTAENKQKLISFNLVVGAVINVVLNLILINHYGLIGAAFATLISYFLAIYLGNAIFKGTRINFKLQTKALLTFYWISWDKNGK